jgi:hypothetical protein
MVSVAPIVSKEKLYEFLAAAQSNEVVAEVNFRQWVRAAINQTSPIP